MNSQWRETERNFIQNHGSPGKIAFAIGWVKLKLAMVGYNFMFTLLSHPTLLDLERHIFRFWRRFSPIRKIGKTVILTRHDDVRRVLRDMSNFSSADAMNKKMPAGPFVLSIDWAVQHDSELRILHDAVGPFINEDAQTIRDLASQRATANIKNALMGGHSADLNVAADYTEDVALHIVTNYIGIVILDASLSKEERNDRENLRNWLRLLAGQIFNPPPIGTELQARTLGAACGLINYIHRCIVEISSNTNLKSKIATSDTILVRLLKLVKANEKNYKNKGESGASHENRYYDWLDNDWVCRLVAGMIVAGNATVTRAETQAIYRLLNLRGAHELICGAAKKYASSPNPERRTGMLQLVYEALRFNPMLPLMSPRYCMRDTVLAANTNRATFVKGGEEVLPTVFAAMFDSDYFPEPNKFKAGRALGEYLHFGFGPHACFGKYIADIQFVETSAQLFGNPGFEVKKIGNTKIKYQGPAAVDYRVRLVKK